MSSLVWADADKSLTSDYDGTKLDVSVDKVFIGLAGFHTLRRIWLESWLCCWWNSPKGTHFRSFSVDKFSGKYHALL